MDEWMSALKGVSNKDFIEEPQNAPPLQDAADDSAAEQQQTRLQQLEDLKLQGQHSWYVASHARPTYCNVCREALSGVTFHGLSCEVCKFRAHKRCAADSPNNCKWTTLASVGSEVLEDDEGIPSMPHQWVEGNLPVSSKCWACEKACGSVLRLLDWRCLWCRATVHTACKPIFSVQCPLGVCRVSVVPPVCLQPASTSSGAALDWWRGYKPPGCSPLLVFVNSKSGDNQGVKFLRRLKQLLNPAQVFDLMAPNGGPLLGLQLFSSFQTFRILVCGGDGSVSWVLSEIDRLRLHKQCQIGVLPLGTGNDLARVLGWGSVCDDDNQLPQLLEKYERATTKLLDRWSILTYEGPLPMPRKLSQPYTSEPREKVEAAPETAVGKRDQSISRLEDSVVDHLSKILESDQHCVVISSARVLCETVRDFILKVQSKTECKEIEDKCSVLNEKLDSLLKSLHEEEQAQLPTAATGGTSPNHKPEQPTIKEPSPSTSPSHQQQRQQPQQYNSNNSTAVHQVTNKSAILQRGALMCRANSLKKALRQIIEHTERAVDEQNALPEDWKDSNSCASRRESGALSVATKSPKHRGYSSPLEEGSSTSMGSSGRPHTLPILETTPDSPRTTNAGSQDNMSNPDFSERQHQQQPCLLQLSSPTASRRISSGSTLKHIGNFGLQLAVTPSFGGGSSSPGGLLTGGARSPEDVDRRMFPIINPLASLPAWPNLAGESSLVGKALLANADALCAAASPLMDIDDMNMDCFQEKCVMNNYFGIGLDAKIALEFHNKREEHPEKCRSRTKNLMWYGVLGGRELLNKTYKNLEQRVHLECDGHRIALPSLQGIVVLNIPSYGGGSNFWGGSKEDDVFFAPAMDDKILEVVAVFGTVQMAASRVINLQHHRIAQCRSVRITITGSEGVPVQVDGEAWLQPPGCVCIQHKNRTQILCRNRQFESSLKSWNEKQRRPSSGSQAGSKGASNVAPAQSRQSSPPPAPATTAFDGGPLSEEEAQHLSTFIDAASQLVQVIQTMSESNPVVDNELWLAASQTCSLIERFFPNGLRPHSGGNSEDDAGSPQRQHFGELISSAKQLQLETKIFLGEKIDDVSRLSSEQEDALVGASGKLENELKRCLTIRTLAQFYDVEQLLVADEAGNPSTRTSSKRRLPMFRLKLRALKASCIAHSETVPLAKLDCSLERSLVRSAPVSPERPTPLTSPVVGSVSEWSSREVLHWLEHSLHLSEYREAFVRHDIQGAELVNLERSDLEQLGVAKVGHAKKILRAIHDLIRDPSRP